MSDQPDGEKFSGPSGALPEEVRIAFLEILGDTLLTIRGNPGLKDLCSILANHAHNIPDILKNPSPGIFRHYWEVERPWFLEIMEAKEMKVTMFEGSWKIIAREYDRLQSA
jgi:hypothetical protein